VVIKARVVVFDGNGRASTEDHERYLERDGADRDGGRGQVYDAQSDHADGDAFADRCAKDRHQFRFIVSAEDGASLDDLKSYTREIMAQMERDFGTRLEWIAVDHWDTDDPHTHILLRGKDEKGRDLVIAREYLSHGMRARASEIATEWLGPRTKLEIRETLSREVSQERWTTLDRAIQRELKAGLIDLRVVPRDARAQFRRSLFISRLDRLADMGLATKTSPGVWTVAPDAEKTLRALGERGDIIRTMQRAFSSRPRDFAIFDPAKSGIRITGRIASKGLADELHERGYLVVDGIDGRAHYVALPGGADLAQCPTGALVSVRAGAEVRPADRTIQRLSENGIYRVERHLAIASQRERNPKSYVEAHVRRLEALRRAGIVERLEEGVWRVPPDLAERGGAYDAKRSRGVLIDIHTEMPIRQQVRAVGATWLDRQLVSGGDSFSPTGFGAEVKDALRRREMFLVEQKLATLRGQRVTLARDLLSTLRRRDVDTAARKLEADTGMRHLPTPENQRVSGLYRTPVTLVSGRFAVLEDGMGFHLVPWRPVLEKRVGQHLSAVVRGGQVSFDFGKERGMAL
jgi:type IV secretory pathway VirD2 relaxase